MITYASEDFKLISASRRTYPEELKADIVKILGNLRYSEAEELIRKNLEKHPDEPEFRELWLNHVMRDRENFEYGEVLMKMRKDFPKDYRIKLMLVFYLIDKGEWEEADKLLGKDRDMRKFTGKKKNEVNVFLHYYWAAAEWAYRTGKLAQARKHHKLLRNYSKECLFFYKLDQAMLTASLLKGKGGYKRMITPGTPKFHHKEFNGLYHFLFFRLPKALVEKIRTLPRETVRKDLVTIMMDGKERYDFFKDNETFWHWRGLSFVMHAFSFLAALRYEEELDLVLELLKDDDYLHQWFGEFFMETLTPVLYTLGLNNLDKLAAFAKHPNLPYGSWAILYKAMSRSLLHESDRKQEVLDWFADIIDFIVEKAGDKRHSDPEFVSIIVNDLAIVGAKELLPNIEKLNAAGLLEESGIEDEIERVRREITGEVHPFWKKKFPDAPWEFFTHEDRLPNEFPLSARRNKLGLKHMSQAWGGGYFYHSL